MKNAISKWNQISLVKRILLGIIAGITLALTIPKAAGWVSIFGTLFVGALKAVAPVLVFSWSCMPFPNIGADSRQI